MKLTLKTTDLLKAVSFAAAVAPSKAQVPIFTHLLMLNDNGSVEFTGSDNQIWCTHQAITDQNDQLRVAIPSKVKPFLETVKDETIHLEVSKSKIKFSSESTRKVEFSIIDDPEFMLPRQEKGMETGFSGEQLKTKLGQVIYAPRENDARVATQGVLFAFKSVRLEMAGAGWGTIAISSLEAKGEGEFIVPKKFASMLLSSLGETDVDAVFSTNLAQFKTGEWSITGRLIDAKFPGYSSLIPAEGLGQIIKVGRTIFLAAARQANLFVCEGPSRWLNIEGKKNKMTITCGEDYEKEIDAECGMFKMALPPDNLIDTLSAMQSDIATIRFVDNLSAVQFMDVDFMALVMQMRG